jgi:hypothetical protein
MSGSHFLGFHSGCFCDRVRFLKTSKVLQNHLEGDVSESSLILKITNSEIPVPVLYIKFFKSILAP